MGNCCKSQQHEDNKEGPLLQKKQTKKKTNVEEEKKMWSSQQTKNPEELQYLTTMLKIVKEGAEIQDRTGVGTFSLLNQAFHFSLRNNNYPLLTTKLVQFRLIFHELKWMLEGCTDATVLTERGVKIWNANSDRKTLDKLGFLNRKEGECGPIYGFQWRHFGSPYGAAALSSSSSSFKDEKIKGGYDQIQSIIHLLQKEPTSRRILLCAWNASQLHQMVLPPCHVMAQFLVREHRADDNHRADDDKTTETEKKSELSCVLTMRSGDMFLGVPFNIASYSLLTIMLAHIVGMTPGDLYVNIGDAHVYKNVVDAVHTQATRVPGEFPKLKIITQSNIHDPKDFNYDDFQLCDYHPQPAIKGLMAV